MNNPEMFLKTIALNYIKFLENSETNKIIDLFAKNGKVNSPLYGIKGAQSFYNELARDTLNSKLKVNTIFEDNESRKVALYFTFHWTFLNKKEVVFDVVDIIEFNTSNEIISLTIIYDTVIARGLLNDMRS